MKFQSLAIAALFLSDVDCLKKVPLSRKICPALGPLYPKPSNIAASPLWKSATENLNQQLDLAIKKGSDPDGTGNYGSLSFSIGFFGVNDEGLAYQRYQTDNAVANSPVGTHHVDGDSIYQIGSISKLLTAYIWLLNGGDRHWYDPITDFIPDLLDAIKNRTAADSVYGVLPKWDEVAVIDIASHTAGIYDDYGLDDYEIGGGEPKGLPKIPKSRYPVCQYQIGLKYYHTCTRKQLLDGIVNLPALFPVAHTPSYSNAGYDLMGFVIEGFTNRSMAANFNESLVKPLNLTNSYYNVPTTTKNGVIPISETNAGWNINWGPTIADGAMFVSTNDFAKIGISILNSTLLPQSVTRRWIKPHTFSADPKQPVGAPWEIFIWETPLRVYNLYTKEGENGNYATLFVLVPDLGVGYSVMTAAPHGLAASAVESMAGLVANATLPAVEAVAKQQAITNFAGTYAVQGQNSSVIVTTDDQVGLKVTQWIYNGTDLLDSLKDDKSPRVYIDFRLWPNELYSGNLVGFSANWENYPMDDFPKSPIEEDCQTWGDFGGNIFGGVSLGAFLFEVNDAGVAQKLTLQAFPLTLEKQQH